ncbi:MAG TPA: hypothetical protein VH743_02400 [Beijerinckiaceae bacterium]|jgi:hypothetical protein
MEAATSKRPESPAANELGDETFMSASDLRAYMAEMDMARASKEVDKMTHADKARAELVKQLSEPIDLTPERLRQIVQTLQAKLRAAAGRGQTELMVMRFPTALCTDKGRALNNHDKDWPETLTGRPRQAYELWRDHLKAAGYNLSAIIVEWPGGLPGDVGFFLKWGQQRR